MGGLAGVLVSGDTTFDVYLAASELIPDKVGIAEVLARVVRHRVVNRAFELTSDRSTYSMNGLSCDSAALGAPMGMHYKALRLGGVLAERDLFDRPRGK